MERKINDRVLNIAHYFLNEASTVRAIANIFDVSKSTVHYDLTIRLKEIDIVLYQEVQALLLKNKREKHLRGGISTKRKYQTLS